jgi:hypothetical protein
MCAFALIIVWPIGFPQIPVCQVASWVPSAPSQTTAKVLSKDLLCCAAGASAIKGASLGSARSNCAEEHPIISISLDNRLFTRPPPRFSLIVSVQKICFVLVLSTHLVDVEIRDEETA